MAWSKMRGEGEQKATKSNEQERQAMVNDLYQNHICPGETRIDIRECLRLS